MGDASVSPSASATIRSAAAVIRSGATVAIVSTSAVIASTIAGINVGAASDSPLASATIASAPAVISSGARSAMVVTSPMMPGMIAVMRPGSVEVIPAIRPPMIATPASSIAGIAAATAPTRPSIMVPNCGPRVAMFAPMFSITGTMFVTTFCNESITFPARAATSASAEPNPTSRFEYAPFNIPIDPEIVDAASSAVVPAIPISVCTVWIASIILSNDTWFTVSAVTVIVSPNTPESFISRAISPAVPP